MDSGSFVISNDTQFLPSERWNRLGYDFVVLFERFFHFNNNGMWVKCFNMDVSFWMVTWRQMVKKRETQRSELIKDFTCFSGEEEEASVFERRRN